MIFKRSLLTLALALLLGGCHAAPAPQPAPTVALAYLTEANGVVKLNLSAWVEDTMAVRLKRGGQTAEGEPLEDEALLDGKQTAALFAAVDAAAYGGNPRPMATGTKGYLWAVRVSEGSTEAPLLFFFLDMDNRATLVVLTDGTQRSFSLAEDQGGALSSAFADIAAQAGMPGSH